MIDPLTLHRLRYALLFSLIAGVVIFVRLLPFGPVSGAVPPPDLIVLTGFAWVLRRPDFVPVVLFAGFLFVTDLMFLRPPGLSAAIGVLGLETLRNRAGLMREQPFPLEWATVAAVLTLMVLARQALTVVFFVEHAHLGMMILGLMADILAYPLVAAVSVLAFGVRRLAPGEHEAEVRLA